MDDPCPHCGDAACPGTCVPRPALCAKCQRAPQGTTATGFLCPACHRAYCEELDLAGLPWFRDAAY